MQVNVDVQVTLIGHQFILYHPKAKSTGRSNVHKLQVSEALCDVDWFNTAPVTGEESMALYGYIILDLHVAK